MWGRGSPVGATARGGPGYSSGSALPAVRRRWAPRRGAPPPAPELRTRGSRGAGGGLVGQSTPQRGRNAAGHAHVDHGEEDDRGDAQQGEDEQRVEDGRSGGSLPLDEGSKFSSSSSEASASSRCVGMRLPDPSVGRCGDELSNHGSLPSVVRERGRSAARVPSVGDDVTAGCDSAGSRACAAWRKHGVLASGIHRTRGGYGPPHGSSPHRTGRRCEQRHRLGDRPWSGRGRPHVRGLGPEPARLPDESADCDEVDLRSSDTCGQVSPGCPTGWRPSSTPPACSTGRPPTRGSGRLGGVAHRQPRRRHARDPRSAARFCSRAPVVPGAAGLRGGAHPLREQPGLRREQAPAWPGSRGRSSSTSATATSPSRCSRRACRGRGRAAGRQPTRAPAAARRRGRRGPLGDRHACARLSGGTGAPAAAHPLLSGGPRLSR